MAMLLRAVPSGGATFSIVFKNPALAMASGLILLNDPLLQGESVYYRLHGDSSDTCTLQRFLRPSLNYL